MRKKYFIKEDIMLKKVSLTVLFCMVLPSCQMFTKPVYDLAKKERQPAAYAIAYQSVGYTYAERVNKNYDVDAFARGARDWYENRINEDLTTLQQQLSAGWQDSDIFAYRSGAVFAAELEKNLVDISKECLPSMHKPSLIQGIYDAMRDLQKNRSKDENDAYLEQGTEQFIQKCYQ